jgi:hypothetical protein
VVFNESMKKNEIILSPGHPSLLENSCFQPQFYAPLIIDRHANLIDGYRRLRASNHDEISVVNMDVPSVYHAAFELNRNTRRWDEIDTFLWNRWAKSQGVDDLQISAKRFPAELVDAPLPLLSALANRKLQLGQAVRILQAPPRTCLFFTEILSSVVRLNVNETANFIDMMFDLANRWNTKNLRDVMERPSIQAIFAESRLDPRQKGEALLKEMRKLRYPLYQRKSEELSTAWHQLHLDQMHAKTGLFLDRGVLEITIRARSEQEMSQQVKDLYNSLDSPAWKLIWDHEQ